MLKNIFLGIKLFTNKPISNFILSVQLSIIAIILLIISNVNAFSDACIYVLQSSDNYRIVQCQDYHTSENENVREDIKKIREKYKSIKGISEINSSFIMFNKQKLEQSEPANEDEAADIELLDDYTINAMRFPLSKGKWLTNELIDGKIPCVIGGSYSNNYTLGQTIKGYAYSKNSYSADDIEHFEIVEREFIVTGILKNPIIRFRNSFVSNNNPTATDLFNEQSEPKILFMMTNGKLANMYSFDDNLINNAFMYLDKNTPETEIEEIRNELTYNFTYTENDFIYNEKIVARQSIQLMMPFITMLFLVVFCGIIAISMLTAIRNLDTFKIYYLTGCPKSRTMGIMSVYALCYFATSSILFYFFMKFVTYFNSEVITTRNAYVVINNDNILFIAAVCMIVLGLSFAIPFFIVKRQNIIDLLRKE